MSKCGFRHLGVREQDIPIIKISHEVENVAEIFARLNQEVGTRVKEADVILALAALRNPGWIRNEQLPCRNDLEERGWDLDAIIFIRQYVSPLREETVGIGD